MDDTTHTRVHLMKHLQSLFVGKHSVYTAVVVQDLATQSQPCKTKSFQETKRKLQKFLIPWNLAKPAKIVADGRKQIVGGDQELRRDFPSGNFTYRHHVEPRV